MAVLTTNVEYLEYGFSALYVQVAATPIAATGAATNKLSATAHGLANGDVVSLDTIVTLTNVAENTRYYVIAAAANDFQIATTPGGSAIVIGNSGSANVLTFTTIELAYPNNAAVNTTNKDYEWEGGDQTVTLSTLSGLTLDIDSASVPSYADSIIFDKDEATYGGGDNFIGFGGGSHKSGATVGMIIDRNAKKIVNGSEIGVVTRRYYYPAGTLTTRTIAAAQSGAVGALFGYSFSATPGNADVNGGAIPGMDSEDFFIHGELS
jgi:hypothetical protein